ncbi:alpha/beta hydrolase [Alteromonas sediminis]|uniref:alpha/beta hydrolase n=1 Tax=Alteromonas sediminis TaxID=2259342 RepID=UPI001405498E|nr:alpha/beta hydrolase [Alteromonas sediminis]
MKVEPTTLFIRGKRVCYLDIGPEKGRPIFYFHGTPSSRIEVQLFINHAKTLNVRVIACDRPGYGTSDFNTNWTFLEWANVIKEIADHLDINKFGILGYSGGGAAALACSIQFSERITFLGLLCAFAPVGTYQASSQLNRVDRFFANIARKFPSTLKVAFLPISVLFKRFPNLMIEILKLCVSVSDREMLDNENFARVLIDSQQEAFSNGTTGAAREALLQYTDWGFNLSDVNNTVDMWFGTHDVFVDCLMSKHIMSNLKQVSTYTLNGKGHFHLDVFEEILKIFVNKHDRNG